MNKIIIFLAVIFNTTFAIAQETSVKVICDDFSSKYADSLSFKQKHEIYIQLVISKIRNFNNSERDSILSDLNSNCSVFAKFSEELVTHQGKVEATRITEDQEIIEFLSQKATINWSKKELDDEISKCGKNDPEYLNLCKVSIKEISLHINYEDFKKISDYQQGRLVGIIMNKNYKQ